VLPAEWSSGGQHTAGGEWCGDVTNKPVARPGHNTQAALHAHLISATPGCNPASTGVVCSYRMSFANPQIVYCWHCSS
jgi:hypothetical protein